MALPKLIYNWNKTNHQPEFTIKKKLIKKEINTYSQYLNVQQQNH